MAHKDFVKRGQAPKKKPVKKVEKPKRPWFPFLITLILVSGFAYFLWAISHPSSSDEVPQEQPQVEPKPQKQKVQGKTNEQESLPEMPEEEYIYPEELEHGSVEIDRKEQEKSARPYLMQCGSFRQKQQAEKMRAQLALQGLESLVKASEGKNGLWYRVILGPYDYKRDAETDRHVIQRIGIGSCQIWYWDL
ncbi:SPOR domain-containing protein [Aliiglaciecola sp. NS0011-25]|uniref:SPOR domain-containing protein n=1 Tax=Aliiglaciecola sp. NS0011-25 TaxID=3127654 RepID=UPI00310245FF